MPPGVSAHLRRRAQARPGMVVHGFVQGADELITSAAATVSMGGYNSVCELLAAQGPALVVPRTAPRMEQTLRAEALRRVGWLDTLPAADLTPDRLGAWLTDAVTRPARRRLPIDLDGLVRIPQLADALLHVSSQEVDHAAV